MGKSWSERLTYLGAFSVLFGAYLLFLKEPAANQKQQAFRIGVLAFGVVIGAIGLVMKAIDKRGGSS